MHLSLKQSILQSHKGAYIVKFVIINVLSSISMHYHEHTKFTN